MSTLKTNTLTGTTSAGSILVTGEGGSTTTNLQQGLAKVWVNFDGSATDAAARDSLNVSGMTDNGTGDYTVTIANDMNNNLYCIGSHTQRNASVTENANVVSYQNNYDTAHAVGSFRVGTTRSDNNSHEDHKAVMLSVHGDLA